MIPQATTTASQFDQTGSTAQSESAPNENVASIDQYRRPSAAEAIGRTAAPRLASMFRSLAERFRRAPDGMLYIDHEQHDIQSTLGLGFSVEGTLTFRHGLLLQGTSTSPKGRLEAPECTVVIDEDASIEIDIQCKTLIVLGNYKGNASVSGLLLNYGSIEGEFEYGALESAGAITGRISRATA